MKNIYLVGFMGCGKTTLAAYLAKSLQRKWFDLDVLIEDGEKQDITHIFNEKGEDYFRDLECQLLQNMHQFSDKIISTGGGIVVRESNRILLKQGICIYLDWPFDTLYSRIAGDQTRPLVKSYEQLQALYEMRKPLYEASCTFHIKCKNETPYSLNEYIVEALGVK